MGSELYDKQPLGRLLSVHDSRRIPVKKSDRKPGPYPYYGASGITDWVDSYIFDGTYLLLAEDGENLKTKFLPVAFIAKGKFWVNNHAHILQGADEYDTRFFSYALKVADIDSYLSGSTRPKLTQRDMRRIPLYAPTLDSRRVIGQILGTLDDKIELNRQMNRTLEAMARAIFKAWFVDFEPVKAKAAGATGFRGMPQEVFDQLPARMTESELGPVPEGWEVLPIASAANISRESVKPGDFPEEVFEHFSIPAFDSDMVPANDLGGSIKSNKYKVPSNCVLVSKLNPRFARVWLPDEPKNGRRQICSTEFLTVSPKEGWTREQLFCQFTEAEFRQGLQQRASGTSNSHQRIKPKDFERTPVIAPPRAVRDAFAGVVCPLFEKLSNGHRESQTLASIRDTLLPKLISGEIRVPEALEGADGG